MDAGPPGQSSSFSQRSSSTISSNSSHSSTPPSSPPPMPISENQTYRFRPYSTSFQPSGMNPSPLPSNPKLRKSYKISKINDNNNEVENKCEQHQSYEEFCASDIDEDQGSNDLDMTRQNEADQSVLAEKNAANHFPKPNNAQANSLPESSAERSKVLTGGGGPLPCKGFSSGGVGGASASGGLSSLRQNPAVTAKRSSTLSMAHLRPGPKLKPGGGVHMNPRRSGPDSSSSKLHSSLGRTAAGQSLPAVKEEESVIAMEISIETQQQLQSYTNTSSSSSRDQKALVPLSMDVALSIYRELVSLVSKLPFKQKLVVVLVVKGRTLRLDLGEVRAAGAACLVGLGLSLGTLLLYRLYSRIVLPFLQAVCRDADGRGLHDEYTLYLEPEDSAVDEMGNTSSKKAPPPAVHYMPGHGVTLGHRPPSLELDGEYQTSHHGGAGPPLLKPSLQGLRHRKSPSPASDRDSAIGCGGGGSASVMSQSIYSEPSTMRDSMYSNLTAESGFEELPCLLRERTISSLKEHHYKSHDDENWKGLNIMETLSDVSSERSSERNGILSGRSHFGSCSSIVETPPTPPIRTNVDPLMERLKEDGAATLEALNATRNKKSSSSSFPPVSPAKRSSRVVTSEPPVTPPPFLSTQSSPYRKVRHPSKTSQANSDQYSSSVFKSKNQVGGRNPHINNNNYNNSGSGFYTSQDESESVQSCDFSAGEIDWDADIGDELDLSTASHNNNNDNLPPNLTDLNQSTLSDVQFQQSLMQRIQEWSTFAEEYNKSHKGSPAVSGHGVETLSSEVSPVRFIRRCRSLDRHLGDTSRILVSDSDLSGDISGSKPLRDEEEPEVEKNLSSLEYELQDIQGEFESITSRLHELIERGKINAEKGGGPAGPSPNTSSNNSPLHRPSGGRKSLATRATLTQSCPLDSPAALRRMRTRWGRVRRDSGASTSSRASSVGYDWDFADYNTGNHQAHEEVVAAMPDAGQLPHHGADPCNMSPPVLISDYAVLEWRGDTDKARRMRSAYKSLPSSLGCERMSVVRGDNYCAVRGALFQMLVAGLPVPPAWQGIIPLMDAIHTSYAQPNSGLDLWSFGQRLADHKEDKLASLAKCALSLYATIEEVSQLPSQAEREKRTLGLLNSGPTFDLELMEGVKLMMALKLAELQRKISSGQEVPIFVHLLFARDSSESVRDFVRNHLNPVGDTGGLEQVEMCLLGHALGVKLRILRLASLGQEDFDIVLPDDAPESWPTLTLMAEDDRHYNVPLP